MLSKSFLRPIFFRQIYSPIRFFSSNLPESPISAIPVSEIAPSLQQKIENLEKAQPFFDRLIFFDPDIMASLPGPLQVFDPIVETTKVTIFIKKFINFYVVSLIPSLIFSFLFPNK